MNVNEEEILKEAFNLFDKFKLQFLTNETQSRFFSYLILEKNFDESAVQKMIKATSNNSKLTLKEIISVWHNQKIDNKARTEQLIQLLKKAKSKAAGNKSLRSRIDFSIDKINKGKIYEKIDPYQDQQICLG